jgi:hypothetical protein
MNPNPNPYKYSNIQINKIGGKKITHKVFIKHNKGYKSISHHSNGKHIRTVKKPLTKKHIGLIKRKKFIKGLFNDCVKCKM